MQKKRSIMMKNVAGEGKISLIAWLIVLLVIGLAIYYSVTEMYKQYEIGLIMTRAFDDVTVKSSENEAIVAFAHATTVLDMHRRFFVENVSVTRKYDQIYYTYTYTTKFGIPFTPLMYPVTFSVTKP